MKASRGTIHYAWVVLAALVVVMLLASGLRAVFGVFIKPMEATFGWDRAALSGAAAVSLLLLGASGPIVGWLADRWGPRRVILVSAIILGVGTLLTARVTALWQVYLTAGVLMALGSGGAGMSTGAAMAARWFEDRRGLVMGVVGGAMSAGQLVIIPLAVWLTLHHGWRQSLVHLGLLLFVIALPLGLLLRDDPAQKGLRPFGATGTAPASGAARAPAEARTSVTDAMQVPAFWLLAMSFFVCGASTNGLIGTHFIAAAVDNHLSETSASSLLAVVGIFDVAGTLASGWLTDRIDPRKLLLMYYGLRGLALLVLHHVLDARGLGLVGFVVLYGLDWVATVPPTVRLTSEAFGRENTGVIYGWIGASHQLGASMAALGAGTIRTMLGDYRVAFWIAAALCLIAGAAFVTVGRRALMPSPAPTPQPALV